MGLEMLPFVWACEHDRWPNAAAVNNLTRSHKLQMITQIALFPVISFIFCGHRKHCGGNIYFLVLSLALDSPLPCLPIAMAAEIESSLITLFLCQEEKKKTTTELRFGADIHFTSSSSPVCILRWAIRVRTHMLWYSSRNCMNAMCC